MDKRCGRFRIRKKRRKIDVFFFFQAEDGIRDYKVTGVQTCALPICEEAIQLRREEEEHAKKRFRYC